MRYSDKGSACIFDVLRHAGFAYMHLHSRHLVIIPHIEWRQDAAKEVVTHARFAGTFALKLLCWGEDSG